MYTTTLPNYSLSVSLLVVCGEIENLPFFLSVSNVMLIKNQNYIFLTPFFSFIYLIFDSFNIIFL